MKILITGSNGFLGSNLVRFFSQKAGYDVFMTSKGSCYNPELDGFVKGDLLDDVFVDNLISTVKPDIVINTVSLVNVDLCEDNPELAYNTTVQTAKNVARSAQHNGSRLIYISTDHLFEGNRSMYSEDDTPMPVNEYGKTKLEAEIKSLDINPDTVIVRTNFFGWSHDRHPATFGEWVYNNLKQQIPMNLFTNYYFTPIEVTYLAEAIETVAITDFTGVINIAGTERCSKYEFGMILAEVFGLDASPINPYEISASSFKARRQQDLSLSTEEFKRIFNQKLPDLREGIQRFYENNDKLL